VTTLTLGVGLAMAAGTVGIVLPVLPGLFVVWAASGVWALVVQSGVGWVVWGVTTCLYGAGLACQYVVPGRRLRSAGVATWTLVVALVAGVVGFFVIPVVGAPLAFAAAIYLASRARYGDHARAWAATKQAARAVLTSVGIELLAALSIIATWIVGVWLLNASRA
jgi:uncharacterized protein YqgC (DUF456 family)